MYVVRYVSNEFNYFLRGTVWAGSLERAFRFETAEAAQAALDKARPFTKAKAWKQAVIVDATLLDPNAA